MAPAGAARALAEAAAAHPPRARAHPWGPLQVFLGKLLKQDPAPRPEFTWKAGQDPKTLDWLGQKAQVGVCGERQQQCHSTLLAGWQPAGACHRRAGTRRRPAGSQAPMPNPAAVQIDAAKAAGVKHVVLVSSMGGTQPDNMLNKIGNGNILAWKRKAEQYLIASGLAYTILHPGGLIDQEGGKRQLVLGVDDQLLQRKVSSADSVTRWAGGRSRHRRAGRGVQQPCVDGGRASPGAHPYCGLPLSRLQMRSIPRADVAELAVQSLLAPGAKNRSLDAITLPEGEGTVTTDWAALFGSIQGTCDYSINDQMATAVAASK